MKPHVKIQITQIILQPPFGDATNLSSASNMMSLQNTTPNYSTIYWNKPSPNTDRTVKHDKRLCPLMIHKAKLYIWWHFGIA